MPPQLTTRGVVLGDTHYTLLYLYHLFPLHAPLTLWLLDAPFGKFSVASKLNLPGNLTWSAMEAVAPATFLTALVRRFGSVGAAWEGLSGTGRILAALYVAHYVHRAFISPLVLAPKRAALHVVVPLAAAAFNLMNGSLLAWSLYAKPPPAWWTFVFGVSLWAVGFVGNIYHDEILHDLRRPPGKRLVSHGGQKTDKKYSIPHGGLFSLVSSPNYLCEWAEWIGFAIAASPGVFVTVPPIALCTGETLGSWLGPVWPRKLLAPAWAFVLAEVTSMLPRALRGHAWYRRTFSEYPSSRKAVIPWLL